MTLMAYEVRPPALEPMSGAPQYVILSCMHQLYKYTCVRCHIFD
jgi:hypothetical protein